MYIFLEKPPLTNDIKEFKMRQSINENYVNYRIDFASLPTEEKIRLIRLYKLNIDLMKFKEDVFLSLPVTKINNTDIEEKQCI